MSPLTQYGRMAEKHWRQFLPRLVQELESTQRLHALLLEAEEKTKEEMAMLREHGIAHGLTPDQAQRQAWETVAPKYLLLPPEA